MSNPYADTPLWAKWYSQEMGWPVTAGVADAADGPVRCDRCGATETFDNAIPVDPENDCPSINQMFAALRGGPPVWREGWRPMALERDYCFGCGILTCTKCENEIGPFEGPHRQQRHFGMLASSPDQPQGTACGGKG